MLANYVLYTTFFSVFSSRRMSREALVYISSFTPTNFFPSIHVAFTHCNMYASDHGYYVVELDMILSAPLPMLVLYRHHRTSTPKDNTLNSSS
jgi:hypothetical protein